MENLRLYCVHLSLLAIENNGAVTVNDQSSRNQPKNSDDKRTKITNETYFTKDFLILKLEF